MKWILFAVAAAFLPEGRGEIVVSRDFGFDPVDSTRFLQAALSGGAKDLVIYGATPAGIAAAVQARKMGLEPILIEPTSRIGGLTTGGLGQTDIGNKAAFGGMARRFYQDIKAYYESDSAWKF